MSPLRISCPTAEAAQALADMLIRQGAAANLDSDGGWEVTIPLLGAARGTVPQTLSATREWLENFALPAVSVTLDGHTHSLRGSLSVEPAPS